MRNLLNAKWLFLVNTLPIVLLFLIYIGEYSIIKTLLKPESLHLWKVLGLSLGVLAGLNFIYAVYLMLRKQVVPVGYAIVAMLSYITFLYIYTFHSDVMIPWSIPRWMIAPEFSLYPGTFLMPTLAWSMLVLIIHFTKDATKRKAWKNFVAAAAIPLGSYLFVQIILPLWQPVYRASEHALIILVILGTLLFLFFLARSVFILAAKKSAQWIKYELIWKIPLCIVLPLLGLLCNNGYLFLSGKGIIGNYDSFWFYFLAMFNGVLLCLPALENRMYRLFLFIARSITFSFMFYFFIVVLPFLPLSVIAIIVFGAGFLLLTPLIVFIIHTSALVRDFSFLSNHYSKKLLKVISVAGFMVIPGALTMNFIHHRSTLNETLDYMYNPDYSKTYKIDKASLRSTLDVIRQHKNSRGDLFFGRHLPYITAYFNWLVMDNLTLSYSKINTIESVFFGTTPMHEGTSDIRNKDVNISKLSVRSSYDETQHAWLSWVDLEITNSSQNIRTAEYSTALDLPAGCFISDYYLDVNGKREPGILAEKKTAMWVFSEIRNTQRDPGILYYLSGDKVAFRVFPFTEGEIRKTGIQFLHKDPVRLYIDGQLAELGTENGKEGNGYETKDVAYLSVRQKQALTKVTRTPYFHFLVDASKNNQKNISRFAGRMEKLIERQKGVAPNSRVSFVSSYVETFPMDSHWKENYGKQTFEGGFYLDRAIRMVLYNAYKEQKNSYPVIIIVTDSLEKAVLGQGFGDLKMAYPETDIFYHDNGSAIIPHSLESNPEQQLQDTLDISFARSVFEYRYNGKAVTYLPYNEQPAIILKSETVELSQSEIKEKSWASALAMQGKWMCQSLHPETSDKDWLTLVKYSFMSKVMSPLTSYIVVENEAQRAMLRKKQEQVLSSNKTLDVGEDTLPMSEPGIIITTLLFLLIMLFRNRHRINAVKMH